ncbi:alpha/beta fold hydrolase [Natrononativus amylolyticus]|uniref:alpha/beta fold hydrolase n=1 Tax=Natrononativus amylolyticus TaxID=2963434 RepID=UPI0020CBBA40|nr:alpha/beta fold hydrolase [Natrononativus amylolyticus]
MTGGTGATTIDGCRIAYRRAGTGGPPVVLLHGGGIDDATLSWYHAIDALADEHRVYAPDWPGYGDSEDALPHSIASYVSVLESFLDGVGHERASLVGLSMGGAAALGLALEDPSRVERLGLVGSYGLGARLSAGSFWRALASVPGANAVGWAALGTSTAATRFGLASVVADASNLDDEFVSAVRSRAGRPGAGRAFEAFQRHELAADGTTRTDFSGELESLAAPTLLVHGGVDPLFPVAWSRRAAAAIPDARLEVLEDCGHWVPRERPQRFNEILRTFLTE